MFGWMRGCRWNFIGAFCGTHLWGCRRCQRIKVQFFKPEAK